MGLTSRPLEVHSRRRHKACICSVILGELESLRNDKGLESLPENFRCKLETFKKIFIFPIPISVKFANSKVLGFLLLQNIA